MNLLLYTEAQLKLSRRRGEQTAARPTGLWNETDVTLPDSLFEELGYYGALDKELPESDDEEDNVEKFLQTWGEVALVW